MLRADPPSPKLRRARVPVLRSCGAAKEEGAQEKRIVISRSCGNERYFWTHNFSLPHRLIVNLFSLTLRLRVRILVFLCFLCGEFPFLALSHVEQANTAGGLRISPHAGRIETRR